MRYEKGWVLWHWTTACVEEAHDQCDSNPILEADCWCPCHSEAVRW